MSWTAPRDYTTNEVVTATILNTDHRDNLLSLMHPLEAPTTANLDVNTTVAETTLYSVTVPSNALGTTGLAVMELGGDLLHNNVAGDTLTIRVKFGGVTQWASGAWNFQNALNALRLPWRLNVELASKGATNAQELFINGHVYAANATPPATTGLGGPVTNLDMVFSGASTSGAPAIDTTANQTLEVTVQWSASSANNSFRRRWARTLIGRN
jgi:hypothetical protein